MAENSATTNTEPQGALSYVLGKGVVQQVLLALAITIILYLVFMVAELTYTSFIQTSSTRVDLIPITVSSQDKPLVFEQNPNINPNKNLPMSDNQRTGAEFSYSFFLWVNQQSFTSSAGLLHIFHKGHPLYYPLMGPGVFLHSETNTLRVYMNSTATWNNYVDVPNLPIKKWVHVTVLSRANTIEVYINGNLASKLNMNGSTLYQNFQNIYCFSQRPLSLSASMIPSVVNPLHNGETNFQVYGPYNGSLSRLTYFSYALSYTEIQSLLSLGPSSETAPNSQDAPPYLQDAWWTTSYTAAGSTAST